MAIEFDIEKDFGVLGGKSNGPQFKLVCWGDKEAKFDIRKWGEDGTPYKGISFATENGMELLRLIGEALDGASTDSAEYTYHMNGKDVPIYQVFGCFEAQGKFNKELTYMSWGYKAKYDLRGWTEDHDRCTKGISLDKDELEDLRDLLCEAIEEL